MPVIRPIPSEVATHKEQWKSIGSQILAHYGCDISFEGIGRAINKWRDGKEVVEQEMIDGLSFLFGDLIIGAHGGRWVMVDDQWGITPAIQKQDDGQVWCALDVVSKRLRDNSDASRELPSIAYVYCNPPDAEHG